jgi:Ca2+-binding EF-hand superfamily protein
MSKPPSKPKEHTTSRLTSSQLYDLYRRLDTNNDGSLDINEFYELSRRLAIKGDGGAIITITEEQLLNAFNMADVDNSGTLEVNEFQMAYDMLYYGTIMENAKAASGDTFVRATRYGFDRAENKYVFQQYTGTLFSLIDYWDYTEPDGVMPLPCSGGLGDIYKMILQDGQTNHMTGSNLLWWIDVAAETMSPGVMATLVSSLGLPNDLESNFTNHSLDSDRDSRLRVGSGVSSLGLEVESLNLFMQSMHLDNSPLVDERPNALKTFDKGAESAARAAGLTSASDAAQSSLYDRVVTTLADYIGPRLAPFFSYSTSPNLDRVDAMHRAQYEANYLVEMDGEMDTGLKQKSVLSDGDELRLPERGGGGRFLLSHAVMKLRPPTIKTNGLSLHLLDQGYGTNTLLTVRTMDAEGGINNAKDGQDPWKLAERSRAGVLGRLLRGVWRKLMVVMLQGGVTRSFSELADSSSNLFHLVVLEVNAFNIDSVSSTEVWLHEVELGVHTCLESKHFHHLHAIGEMAREVRRYLAPMLRIFEILARVPVEGAASMSQEGWQDKAVATTDANHHLPPAPPVQVSGSGSGSGVGIEESNDTGADDLGDDSDLALLDDLGHSGGVDVPTSSFSVGGVEMQDGAEAVPVHAGVQLSPSLREGSRQLDLHDKLNHVGPPNSTEFTLSWKALKKFLGPRREGMLDVLRGNNQCEMKGMEFWARRYDGLMAHLHRVEDQYRIKLSEKRNFWLTLLTLVLVVVAPLMFFTTYWSMNFDNMTEYEVEQGQSMTGVGVVWHTWFIVYSVALVAALHFRLFEKMF